MFGLVNNSTNLPIRRLIMVLKNLYKYDLGIKKEDVYDFPDYKGYDAIFDNVKISDLVITESSSDEQEHHITITVFDKSQELTVYKSPIIYVDDNSKHPDIYTKKDCFPVDRKSVRYKSIKWAHKGEWCTYIVSKIKELERKINDKEQGEKTKKIQQREDNKKVANNKITHFKDLFKEKAKK